MKIKYSSKSLLSSRQTSKDKDHPMIKYGELHKALSFYTREDIHESIPVDYYRRVIKASFRANSNGLGWDVQQAASVLLYLAFNEGHINPNQLNTDGLKTLDWAEEFLAQIHANTLQKVISALHSA
jgi:hypothetical protein